MKLILISVLTDVSRCIYEKHLQNILKCFKSILKMTLLSICTIFLEAFSSKCGQKSRNTRDDVFRVYGNLSHHGHKLRTSPITTEQGELGEIKARAGVKSSDSRQFNLYVLLLGSESDACSDDTSVDFNPSPPNKKIT